MAWWSRRRRDAPSSPAGVDAAALEAAVAVLRGLLTDERDRLRPDTWRIAWRLTESAGEYLPAWDGLTSVRPVETQELVLLLECRLTPALHAFLAVPDSQKPVHADALHAQLRMLEVDADRLRRRLTRALASRLHARSELERGPHDGARRTDG